VKIHAWEIATVALWGSLLHSHDWLLCFILNIQQNTKYYFYLINRPILVLKCDQGFVGYKAAGSVKLECNKASYATIQVERVEEGQVHFKGQNGKYWHVTADGICCDSEVGQGFSLELREPTKMCIKTSSGKYVVAGKNGSFSEGGSEVEAATRWEYWVGCLHYSVSHCTPRHSTVPDRFTSTINN